jgi:subtilisin-like proprotein convertase family protein
LNLEFVERRDLPSTSIPLSLTNWTALGPAPLVAAQTPGNLPATGRAAGLAVHPTDPNTIYVGTAGGGVWKTTNGNATNPTWTSLTSNEASPFIGCITLAPSNPNIVYVGTGEAELRALSFYGRGVLKSTDAGATWTLLGSSVFDRTAISNIVVHPTNPDIVFAAVCGHATDGNPAQATGVFRSTDGGLTWTNTTAAVTTVDDFTDLEADPADPNVLWAGVGTRLGGPANGVWRTANALSAAPTWTRFTNIVFGSTVGRTEVAIAPSNNQVVYVSMADTIGGLRAWYQSTTGGATWIDRTTVAPGTDRMWFCNNLLVDRIDPQIVYFSGTTNLGRSTNGGATWTAINSGVGGTGPHVDHHGFAFDSLGRFLDVSDGGIYRWTPFPTNVWVSLNGLNSSRDVSGAINSMQFMGIGIHPTDPDFVIGGTQDNGLQRFRDSLGWTLTEGGDGGDVIIDPFNPNRMWRVNPVPSFGANGFVRRSTNGGNSWVPIVSGITNASTTFAFYPPIAADPATSGRIFLGSNVLYTSTNAGDTWTRLPGDTFTFPNFIRAIGIGPANSGIIYASCGADLNGTVNADNANQIFVTTNNGQTWTERTPFAGGDFQNFVVDPTNSNIAYVVNANFSPAGHVFRTTNAGLSWTNVGSTLPDVPFYDVLLDPGSTPASGDDVLFAAGDMGVYRSANLGAKWTKYGFGLPIAQVRDIEFSPFTKILAAATHGRGIWEILTAPPPGQIFGTIYHDANANGTQNPGEPGLPGWTVFRDDNNNGAIDNYGSAIISATGLPTPIPDNSTITSNLVVSGLLGAITDVNVTLNITHPFVGNLVVSLTNPAGTTVTLFANIGGSGNNFTSTTLDDEAATPITSASPPYTGSFQPQQFLVAMDAQLPNGTWTLTVSDTMATNSGTLNSWSIQVATGEPTAMSRPDGSYTLRGNPPGTYTIRRVLQSGWFPTEPPGGAAVVTLGGMLGVAGVNFGQTQTPPVKVDSVVINGGQVQRSRVTQVVVNFDQVVVLPINPADAFQIRRVSDSALVALTASVNNTTFTSVTLTFNGALSEFGSLADGRYTLTIFAASVSNAAGQLDGNGDGIAGDNFTFGHTQGLFRFFGDANGDRNVDIADFGLLSGTYGLTAGQTGFLALFDFNNDGVIDIADFGQFSIRIFTGLP